MTLHATVSQDVRQSNFGDMLQISLATRPDGVAFRHNGLSLRRSELDRRARDLAAELTGAGLQPGEPVVIDLPHGLGLCIAMVAVPLAGGCAVPLDAALPASRRDAIRDDVGARLSLVQSDESAGLPVICRAGRADSAERYDADLLFLVYTSGSTGGPKGVKISQMNYVSRMAAIVPADGKTADGVDLCWTPASFIGMLDEIYFPLLANKPSVIASPDIRVDFAKFGQLVASESVTSFRVTPSLLSLMIDAGLGPSLRSVEDIFCSGEAVSHRLVRKVKDALGARLWCFYGATEAPGIAFVEAGQDEPVHYRPQPFVKLRIVGADGRQVASGETGEIWVGGDVVSPGYWKNDALTAETFDRGSGTWWYRTGDLGRMCHDGRVEILGRSDLSECKVNGVRISLDEIRSAICDLPGAKDGWVSVLEPTNEDGQIQLIGHAKFVENCSASANDGLERLNEQLPSAARLSALLWHDSFPLTANGKLDLQVIMDRARTYLAKGAQAPESQSCDTSDIRPEIAKLVLEVAEEIVGTGPLRLTDNFFRAGGNSLAAVRYALALSDRLAHDVASSVVFNADSFQDIAHSFQRDAPHAASALRLLRPGASQNKRLFTINSTGNYAQLAQFIVPSVHVHNLNIFGLALALEDRVDRFELAEVVALFADELIALSPEGPWPLLAYCQDGCLAVETARVLQSRTGTPADLFLIDTFFTDHRRTFRMNLQKVLESGVGWAVKKMLSRIRSGLVPKKRPAAKVPSPHQTARKVELDTRLRARFCEHFMSYAPAPLDAPVSLFISREWRHANLAAVRTLSGSRLAIREIAGDHQSLFREDSISETGAALNEALERAGLT